MASLAFAIAPGVDLGGDRPVVIAGPCVLESADLALAVAEHLRGLADRLSIPVVFKSSFDKANRSSLDSYRGPGLDEGLRVLEKVRDATGLPLLTDVHEPQQAVTAGAVVDMLQVPAFLCRQTDLLLACGRTGTAVNVKKGQFLAPEDVERVVEKVRSTGNDRVSVTERGATFGYHNLVVDMRGFAIMRSFAPVVFDVTHSLQLPGGLGHATAGAREYHPMLARAAAGAGVDGFFVEVHPEPSAARSDSTTQLSLDELDRLLPQLVAVDRVVREMAAEERP